MLKHARFVARRDCWCVGNALLLVVLGMRIGGSLKTCVFVFQAAFCRLKLLQNPVGWASMPDLQLPWHF